MSKRDELPLGPKVIDLPDGYYVLTKDIPNPWVDRRMRGNAGQEIWKAGKRFRLQHRPGEVQSIEVFDTVTRIYFHKDDEKEVAFLASLQGNLKPAPKNLGQIKDEHNAHPDSLLAYMLENGTLTVEQVEAAAIALEAFDENQYDAINRKQWV